MSFRSAPSQSSSDYAMSNMNSEPYNYYDTSSYWNSYSAWQQGYYESEPTSDNYNNYVSDQKPEEDELELIGNSLSSSNFSNLIGSFFTRLYSLS